MLVVDQKQKASGSFQQWAAYQLIRPERIQHGCHRQLAAGADASRPVNSGVRFLLNGSTQESDRTEDFLDADVA